MGESLTFQQLHSNSIHLVIRTSLLAIQTTLSLQQTMLQSDHDIFTNIKSTIVAQNTTLQNTTRTLVEYFSKISTFQPPPTPPTPSYATTIGSTTLAPHLASAAAPSVRLPLFSNPPHLNSSMLPLRPSSPPLTTITTTTTSLPTTTNPLSAPTPIFELGSPPQPFTPLFAIGCITASPLNPSTSAQNIHPPSILVNKTKTKNLEPQPNQSLQKSDLEKLKLHLISQESMVSPYLRPCPDLLANPSSNIDKQSENANTPSRASSLSIGYDLSHTVETKILAQGTAIVPTDLSISIPNSTYARLAPRSGLAWKQSIDVGPGVVNANYANLKLNIAVKIAHVERIEKSDGVEDS